MHHHPSETPARPRSAGIGLPVALALASAAGVWALWRVFVDTVWGQEVDGLAANASLIGAHLVVGQAQSVLNVVSVGAVAVAMVVVGGIALIRRRWVLGALAVGVLGAANLTTHVLKFDVFTRPVLLSWDYGLGNSLPSGHTTASSSAMVALLLVVGPRWRNLTAAIGSVVMFAFGYASLVTQAHRPADVVAGYLVCLGWGFVALTVLAVLRPGSRGPAAAGRPPRSSRWLWWLLLGAGVVLLASGALLLPHHHLTIPPWEQSRSVRLSAYAGATMAFAGVAATGMAVLSAVAGRLDAGPERQPVAGDRAHDVHNEVTAHA